MKIIKSQRTNEVLSQLGIRTRLTQIPLLITFLSWAYKKVNAIISKFLLAGDMFTFTYRMPGLTYRPCGLFIIIIPQIYQLTSGFFLFLFVANLCKFVMIQKKGGGY